MINSTSRCVFAIVASSAFWGFLFQDSLRNPALSAATRYMRQHERLYGGSNSDSTSTTSIVDSDSNTVVSFNAENPLVVLSLPNHNDLVIPRYFECAGHNSSTLGRHWTGPPQPGRWPLGKCMNTNLKKKQPPMQGCRWPLGECINTNLKKKQPPMEGCGNHHVYTELQFLSAPFYMKGRQRRSQCLDPVLYPGALDQLYQQYPNATILNMVRDPVEWFQTLSPQIPHFWNEWCNQNHDNAFPTGEEVGKLRPMVRFYMQYQRRLKQFVKSHPTWKYIEVNLEQSPQVTARHLEEKLAIPDQCWIDSSQGNLLMVEPDPTVSNVLPQQVRPNTVGWPILNTGMPKAGTSTMHNYFRCGLGDWASAHQWTTRTVPPHNAVPVGVCLLNNSDTDHYPFFHGCGDQLVWSDTGVLQSRLKTCYYPFLHKEGLERFYKSYPYGTILNTVRNTQSWVSSAFRWNDLPERWVMAECEGFITDKDAPAEEWEAWYDGLHDIIRQFAKEHPTLTYIEVPLSNQTGSMLHDIFRFPEQCWGHFNVNTASRNHTSREENATQSA